MTRFAPGSMIGILGGGQLGRMIAVAAAQLGYRCHIYAPEADSVAAHVAAHFTCGAYDDHVALAKWAAGIDVATYEFENVPVDTIDMLEKLVPVRPGAAALRYGQDRADEKNLVRDCGGRTADFAVIDSAADLLAAAPLLTGPVIMKTRRLGYDGKGQVRLAAGGDAAAAWEQLGKGAAIIEAMVDFAHEFSVILVRGADGEIRFWDSPDNVHADGILARSSLPAPPMILAQQPEAQAMAAALAQRLDYVGVLTVEFFATANGPLINEFAPRVHNSGHWTIEGAATSQFENHVRAVCGLPLGDCASVPGRITMFNLIGEDVHQWADWLARPGHHLHLYGKADVRTGRKLGHVTAVEFPGRE